MSDAMTSPTPAERAKQLADALDLMKEMWLYHERRNGTPTSVAPHIMNRWGEALDVLEALAAAPQAQQAPAVPMLTTVTEEMHVAACKVLLRAPGLAGLPQRMLNAMLADAPSPSPAQAPVEAEPALCECKDRPASQCPGTWEQGCDMGANEKFVRVSSVNKSLQRTISRLTQRVRDLQTSNDWHLAEAARHLAATARAKAALKSLKESGNE